VSRVLFLLPSVPEPPDSGEQHVVDAIAFGKADELPRLAGLAERARVMDVPATRNALERTRTLGTTSLPDMAVRLWSPEFADAVRCWQTAVDFVQAEGIEMARYLAAVPPAKRV
jgi:hypothetical protein